MAEASSKGTSTSGVEHKPTHAGFEEDEDSAVPLRHGSHRTKGPVVVTVEKLSEEVAIRQVTGDKSVTTPVSTKIAPSGFLQSQRKSIDPKNILSDSPIEMMPLAGIPEQSPTTGLVGARFPAAGFHLPQYRLHHQVRN